MHPVCINIFLDRCFMNLPHRAFPFLWQFIKRQPYAFLFIFSAPIIWGLYDIAFPYFSKLIIDTVHDYQGPRAGIYSVLTWPLGMILVFWVATEIIVRSQGILLIYTFPTFRANIRYAVFDYVKNHSHEYFSSHFAGNIARKLADLPTSAQTVLEIICFNFVSIMVSFLFALVLMWWVNPIFAWILLGWFMLHMASTFVFLRQGNQRWEIHSKQCLQ